MRSEKSDYNYPSNYDYSTSRNEGTERNYQKDKHILRKEKRPHLNRKIHVSDQQLIRATQNFKRNEENFNNQFNRMNLRSEGDNTEIRKGNQKFSERYNKYNNTNTNPVYQYPQNFNQNVYVDLSNKENFSSQNLMSNCNFSCRDRENHTNCGSINNYNKFTNLIRTNDKNTNNDSNYDKHYGKFIEYNSKKNQTWENLDTPKITAETDTVPEHEYNSSSECESLQEQKSQNLLTISKLINHKQISGDHLDRKDVIRNLVSTEKAKYPTILNNLLLNNKEKIKSPENIQDKNTNLNFNTTMTNFDSMNSSSYLDPNVSSFNYPNSNNFNDSYRNLSNAYMDQSYQQLNPNIGGLPFNSGQAHNNFYFNANITNLNFHNYPNHSNKDSQTVNDEAHNFNYKNTSYVAYNTNKNMKKYYNNYQNQNNRRRNTRYAFNNANSYRQKENFELKGNIYNYNYRAYNNRERGFNNFNTYNNLFRSERTDVQEINQYYYTNNIQTTFQNKNFINNPGDYSYFYSNTPKYYGYNFINPGHIDSDLSMNKDAKFTDQNSQNNLGILDISIKLEKETKIISLNRCDDFFQIARDFCLENKLPQKLILPLYIKLYYAVNSINRVLNTNITEEDKEYLDYLNHHYCDGKTGEEKLDNPEKINEEDEMTFSSISNIDENTGIIKENTNITCEKSRLNRTF